jgi:hypothetical protein
MPSELTRLVRRRVEEACRALSQEVAGLGFERTRKMFWVRVHEHTADVLHIHRSGVSYGAPLNASVSLRLHLAIRVLNDPFPAIALNGPSSDPAPRDGRYHLRFNAESLDSFDPCVRDLARYVREIGEPWFSLFRDANALLLYSESPLKDAAKASLRASLEGHGSAEVIAATKKELGLNRPRANPKATGGG